MACAVSIFTATPRDVNCGEIGTIAKIVPANNRAMSDPVFIGISLFVTEVRRQDDHRT
jgi:hypothetical protein